MITVPGYDIRKPIYKGATCELYRAIRLGDQETVIIKLLAQGSINQKNCLKFTREYHIASQLDSPFVPKYLGIVFLENNNIAIIIKDNEAIDLASYIPPAGLALEDFLKIAIELVKGLDDIHRANVVHADIKPSNIILNLKNRQLQYIDFGSASLLRQETKTPISLHQAEGSLSYISPEQTGRVNRVIDYRTDFYSLGVTFYQLLCGQLPFSAQTPIELIHSHIAKMPLPLHEVKTDLPQVLSKIISKLLSKNPEDRYQSCFGILKDLTRCLAEITNYGTISNFTIAESDFSENFQIPQKLYGRDKEIRLLQNKFDSACEGATEVLMVAGYSGIGKSFLVHEVQPRLTLKNGVFVSGKFDQLNKNIAYSAIIEVLRALIQQLLTGSEESLGVWKEKLISALGNNAQFLIDLIPELEIIIGKQDSFINTDPVQAKNRFTVAVIEFLKLFSQREHPLVIFLDDLQWADLGSVELFEFIIKSHSLKYILFIGAYRDNEINDTHPVQLLLNNLALFGRNNVVIHLGPLNLEDVNHWISEALHTSLERSRALSECTFKKTAGNPFFIKLFLQSLYDGKLIKLTSEGTWEWDLTIIEQHPASDNVIQLMNHQINYLPERTQKILALASCFGKSFTLDNLNLVTQGRFEQAVQELTPAINMGLLHQIDDQFIFAHDRVQEAIYALLKEEEKKRTHLFIGKAQLALHKDTEISQLDLYSIVNHFNVSESLITARDERNKIAQYNFLAAKKAKSAGAYATSLAYLYHCQQFCDGRDIWSEDSNFSFSMCKELAEVEYLNGHFEKSEAIIYITQSKLTSAIEIADLYNLLIIQKTLQGNYEAALELGNKALQLLKISLPLVEPRDYLERELDHIRKLLSGRTIESLIDNQAMANPEYKAAMKILLNLYIVGYLSGSDLLPTVVLLMTRLSIEHGHVPESCMAYAAYGMLLCASHQEYNLGNDCAKLAIKLSEKLGSLDQKCRSYNLIVNCIYNWTHPIQEVTPLMQAGYNAGIASGELQYAGYIAQCKIRTFFDQGMALYRLNTEIDNALNFSRETKNQIATDLILAVKIIGENLAGKTKSELDFQADGLNDEQFQMQCKVNGSLSALPLYYIMKAQALYLYGYFDLALQAIRLAEPLLSYIPGQYALSNYNWYYSLILLALSSEVSEETKKEYIQIVDANQIQMKAWASFSQANFSHKYDLVAAELARVAQHPHLAQKLYSKALKSCREQGLLHEQGLICQHAAKFWQAEDETGNCAQGFIKEAYRCYNDRGARRLADSIQRRHDELFAETSLYHQLYNKSDDTSISGESLRLFDLANLLKISQTISQEVDLPKLLTAIMEAVVFIAGAQKATLVLARKSNLTIQAEYLGSKKVEVLKDIPLEEWDNGASSIIKYVSRSRSPIILGNASEEGLFTQDEYIKAHKTKSILCLPIFSTNELKALLYLENDVSKYAFTKQHLDFLNVLATQMVISLQNAFYHSEQIEFTTKLTEQSARAAAAENFKATLERFIADLSHEIINPMYAMSGSIEMAIEAAVKLYDIIRAFVEKFHEKEEESKLCFSSLQDALNNLTECNQYIMQTTRNVLRWQKMESGMSELENHPFSPNEVVNSLLKIFSTTAQKKQIALNSDIPEEALLVKGDKALLKEVLFNLMSNAIKFTNKGSITIKLRTTSLEENRICLQFSIIDTGMGMSSQELEKLFLRFSQGQTFRKSSHDYNGTGLGLSICKKLIELLGGDISVQSVQSEGSIFLFTMPCERLTQKERLISEQHAYAQASSSKTSEAHRILVAEDNSINLQILVKRLEKRGYICHTASDGKQALEMYKSQNYDLLLLDIEMPIMTGLDAAEAVREFEKKVEKKNTPIIFLSAHSEEELKAKISRINNCGYFYKGSQPELLIAEIEKSLLDPYAQGAQRVAWQFGFSETLGKNNPHIAYTKEM